VEAGLEMLQSGGNGKNQRPGQKTADRNDRACRSPLMRVPEIEATAQINYKKNRINTKVGTAGLPPKQH
jgi:hypothetical protein